MTKILFCLLLLIPNISRSMEEYDNSIALPDLDELINWDEFTIPQTNNTPTQHLLTKSKPKNEESSNADDQELLATRVNKNGNTIYIQPHQMNALRIPCLQCKHQYKPHNKSRPIKLNSDTVANIRNAIQKHYRSEKHTFDDGWDNINKHITKHLQEITNTPYINKPRSYQNISIPCFTQDGNCTHKYEPRNANFSINSAAIAFQKHYRKNHRRTKKVTREQFKKLILPYLTTITPVTTTNEALDVIIDK